MEVVEEIKAMGGEAVADGENVADFDGAGRMVQRAIDTFGRLDTLVNNAGILRDRMLANMEEAEWDAVIAVHLKGAFAPDASRGRVLAGAVEGRQRRLQGRIVNTSSPSGVFGNAGPDELRRGQGRHRRVHDHLRSRARPLRRAAPTRSRRSRAPA